MTLPVHTDMSPGPVLVHVTTRGVAASAALERVVSSYIRTALGRFGRYVRNVHLWIEDTNGPRDGSGIRCRIEVTTTPGGLLVASAEAPHEFAAVARCSLRARALVDRRLKKRRHIRRRPRVRAASRSQA